jgi:hypothetical protein
VGRWNWTCPSEWLPPVSTGGTSGKVLIIEIVDVPIPPLLKLVVQHDANRADALCCIFVLCEVTTFILLVSGKLFARPSSWRAGGTLRTNSGESDFAEKSPEPLFIAFLVVLPGHRTGGQTLLGLSSNTLKSN